jgi:hypothetical protein
LTFGRELIMFPSSARDTVVRKLILYLFLGPLIAVGYSQAQSATQQAVPKTKLEAFEAQEGAVLIRGFTQIGDLRGAYGGLIAVKSQEFTNATTGRKEYGITIDVKETGRLEREDRAFIDYEEIPSLIKGIDYISKVDKCSTKLDNYQADYRTKGDFQISKFSASGEDMFSVSSGRIGRTSVYLKSTDMTKFRDLIGRAKAKLDSIKSP